MEMLQRIRVSHRYASHAVRYAVAGARAYGTAQPGLLLRTRMYLAVLRDRLAKARF